MTVGRMLLDTGPLVALLHRNDRDHDRCAACLASFRGILVTTEAVLTEGTHLLSRIDGGPQACLDFFLRGGAILVPASRGALVRCHRLMVQYHDVPMDYADATLVALGEETGIRDVFTLDRRGFAVYRRDRSGAFAVRP